MGNTGWRSAVKQEARMRIKGHIGKLFVVSLVYGAIRLVLTSQNTPHGKTHSCGFPPSRLIWWVCCCSIHPYCWVLPMCTWTHTRATHQSAYLVRWVLGFWKGGVVQSASVRLFDPLVAPVCGAGIIKAISYSQSYF
jgi:hypothetical protein